MREPFVKIITLVEPTTQAVELPMEDVCSVVIAGNKGPDIKLVTSLKQFLELYCYDNRVRFSDSISLKNTSKLVSTHPCLIYRVGSDEIVKKDYQLVRMDDGFVTVLEDTLQFYSMTFATEETDYGILIGKLLFRTEGFTEYEDVEGIVDNVVTDPYTSASAYVTQLDDGSFLEQELVETNTVYTVYVKDHESCFVTSDNIQGVTDLVENGNVFVSLTLRYLEDASYPVAVRLINDPVEGHQIGVTYKDVEYIGSVNPDHINQYGKSDYIMNINNYDIPFRIKSVVPELFLEGVNNYFEGVVGRINPSLTIPTLSIIDIVKGHEENIESEQAVISYMCMVGEKFTDITALVMMCEQEYIFFPYSISNTNGDATSTVDNAPSIFSDRLLVMAPDDVDTSYGFAFNLDSAISYLQTVKTFKGSGQEFLDMWGEECPLPISKLQVSYKRSARETLLDSDIMTIKNIDGKFYLNKNMCHNSYKSVVSSESNQRLMLKINRDLLKLIQKNFPKRNNALTRSRMSILIKKYFENEIMILNPTLAAFPKIQCDENNNTKEIIAARKFVIDVSGIFETSIYEVNLFHRIFDVSNAPTE
jgi:hypothetical protein